MEKTKKNLFEASVLVLVLTALSLVRNIIDVIKNAGKTYTNLPEGVTQEIMQIAMITLSAFAFVFVFLGAFVGFKGLMIATGKSEYEGKAHIILANILLVLFVIALISTISTVFKATGTDLILNIAGIVSAACSCLAYFLFAKSASDFRKANK